MSVLTNNNLSCYEILSFDRSLKIMSNEKYLIRLSGNTSHHHMSSIYKYFWEEKFHVDVTISTQSSNENYFTFFPFTKDSCWAGQIHELYGNDSSLFPEKFANMYGCDVPTVFVNSTPIATIYVHNDSITTTHFEAFLVDVVADKFNFTLSWQRPPKEDLNRNLTVSALVFEKVCM